MELKKKIGIMRVFIFLIAIAIICSLITEGVIKISNVSIENKKAQEYGELQQADISTQSENVDFSAFFAKDLDGDGKAERIKGATTSIGNKNEELYFELKVSQEGYLEGGYITIAGNNINWSTTVVEDNIVSGDYIGNTSQINLKNKVYAGSQKLFSGVISPKLNNNINSYSQTNTVTLHGTYVNNNEERQEINISRNVQVDWYGTVLSSVDTANQQQEIYYTDDQMQVNVNVTTIEKNQQLKLKDNIVTIQTPELNGYKAESVSIVGVDYTFDQKTGIITINRSSIIDQAGNIVSTLSNINKYKVTINYPIEARGANEFGESKRYTSIEIPVTSTYTGYNNQTEGFTKIEESTQDAIIALVEAKSSDGDIVNQATISIGEYSELSQRSVISKEKALQVYNGLDKEEDNYEVMWGVIREGGTQNLQLVETKADEALASDSSKNTLENIVTYKGIYFQNGEECQNIKIYNAETNELIAQFANGTKINKNNPYMYETAVKKVRVEIGELNSMKQLNIFHIKQIDGDKMVHAYTKDQFDKFGVIYTYASITSDNITYSEHLNNAVYSQLESQATMQIAKKEVKTTDKDLLQTITITTSANDINQMAWKNGEFLVKMPKEIINAKLEEVQIDNNYVEIKGSNIYKQNGQYFIKIITANDVKTTYNLTIRCKITMNPMSTTNSDKYVLYAYNQDCNTYYWSAEDTYDVNDNFVTSEKVGTYTTYTNITAPSTLITSQSATNYKETEETTIAPNIAPISKTRRTADININLLNNYNRTISDIQILGTIPFENNTFLEGNEPLGSEFTATMQESGIRVPAGYEGKVKIYYTQKANATKDLENESNGWTQTPEDYSKVKRYLIDFGNNVMSSGSNITFTYTVKIPENLEYNKHTFTDHIVYFALNTTEGKLFTQAEPSKLGLRKVRNYGLELLKENAQTSKTVTGAVFQLKELDDQANVVSTKYAVTNSQGKLNVNDLYVGRKYILEETKNPNNYSLNENKIEFKVVETANNHETSNNPETTSDLEIQVLSTAKFKTNPTIQNDIVYAGLLNEPRYKLNITKKDKDTSELLNKIRFMLLPQNEQYMTNTQGKIEIDSLDQNTEYILKEINADGFYKLQDITFKLQKDETGTFKVISNNQDFANATVTINPNEDLIEVAVNINNERQPSILINKIDETTNAPIQNIEFEIEGRTGKVYKTDENGQVTINSLEENQEYTLKETKTQGYYPQTIVFTIVKDTNNHLKVESQNQSFANAVVIDEARKILSVTLPNEKIPTYNLKLTKIEEGSEETKLKDAEFQIIEEDTNKVIETTTNENGEINFINLYKYVEGKAITGKYTLRETKAPAGYSNKIEEIKFRVVKNGEELSVEIENRDQLESLKTAEIVGNTLNLVVADTPLFTLNKVDSQTHRPLANAQFIIYEIKLPIDYAKDINGNYVGTQNEKGQYIVTTDENGKITLPLKNGKYSIIEVGYPEGYKEEDLVEYFVVGKEEGENTNQNTNNNQSTEPIKIQKIEDLVQLSVDSQNRQNFSGKEIVLENTLDFQNDESYNNPQDTSFGDINGNGIVEGLKTELTTNQGFKGFSYQFQGTFDGNNNEIKNIYIARPERTLGLFWQTSNATIKNLKISGKITTTFERTTTCQVGMIGNASSTKIINCEAELSIFKTNLTGNTLMGGIAGRSSSSTIENCLNKGTVTGTTAGGIVGSGSTTQISNSYNNGIITGTTVGGIAGKSSNSSIFKCYNTKDINIEGDAAAVVGGIVGNNATTSYGNIATGDTLIALCYNTGNITVNSNASIDVGGIIGVSTAHIKSSYNRGNITATSNSATATDTINAGGIAGRIYETSQAIIKNTYFAGNITTQFTTGASTNTNAGGIVGTEQSAVINNNFYSNNAVITANNISTKGNTVTNDHMKTAQFIEELNAETYMQDTENQNEGYPVLKNTEKIDKTSINSIEDLVELSIASKIGKTFEKEEIKLEKTLDFLDDASYNNPNDTSFGDLNEDGITETIKEELSKGKGYTPINSNSSYPFKGIFNGNNKEIKNIYINQTDGNAGLFSNIQEGTVKDLTIRGSITGQYYVGSISATTTGGNYINCHNYANIQGQYAGGIIGQNNSSNASIKIENCSNNATITSTGFFIGGIVGCINNNGIVEIKNCNNHGDLKDEYDSDNAYIGGILGNVNSNKEVTIENCHNTGTINTKQEKMYREIGGIVGHINQGNLIIKNCYNEANINSASGVTALGGILGKSYNQTVYVEECYNTGNMVHQCINNNDYPIIGGLIGSAVTTEVKNSYNSGDLYMSNNERSNSGLGGIIGNANTLSVTNTYNTGNITLKNNQNSIYIGGISGKCTSGTISNCYSKGTIYSEKTFASYAGYDYIGGIAATSITNLENSYNTGNIVVKTLEYAYVGGIAGQQSNISKCYNTGNISVEQQNGSTPYIYVGGILGHTGNVEDTYNTGNVSCKGEYHNYVGGILGFNTGEVQNSYNTGKITGKIEDSNKNYSSIYVGGIAGKSYNIGNCYNQGEVQSFNSNILDDSTSRNNCGGIIGEGNAQNSYNTGNVVVDARKTNGGYGSDTYCKVGGISGKGYANNSYNAGNVNVKTENLCNIAIGKIAGIETQEEVQNSYISTMTVNIDTTEEYTTTVNGIETPIDGITELESQEYYNTLNKNLVWAHLEEKAPRLLIKQAEAVDTTNVEIANNIKEYEITTVVEETDGIKGGTITGEGETPFETVKYGQDNVKTILITPNIGYSIESIKINGEPIEYVQDENGQCEIANGFIKNITENKQVSVKFVLGNKIKQKVTVHHYLKQEDGTQTTIQVADDEEKIYNVGESYETSPKIMLQNIELEKNTQGKYIIPENATGIVALSGNTVTYYYVINPIKLTINHYIAGTEETVADQESKDYQGTANVEDNMVVSVNVNQNYEVENNATYKNLIENENFTKSLITHDGTEVTGENPKVNFTNNSTLSYFYTLRDGIVKVKYVNKDTGLEISEQTVLTNNIGTTYNVQIKQIEGYEYIEREGDLEGEFSQEEKIVTLYYKAKAKITVNYINIITNEILETEEKYGLVGEEFTGKAKEIENFDVVEKPENETVILLAGNNELNYYYNKPIDVTVKYVNEKTGRNIIEPEVKHLHIGDHFETTAKEIEGYQLIRSPETQEGYAPSENIDIVYAYLRKAVVEVIYKDKNTGKEIADKTLIEGLEGRKYVTNAKEIEYYNLAETPVNAKGNFEVKTVEIEGQERANNKVEVTYNYIAKDFNLGVEKKISKILVNGVEQNIPNGKFAKLEIHRNNLDNTDVIIEYTIKMYNSGEIAGGATVIETIPEGFSIKQEENLGWEIIGQTAKVKVEKLEAKAAKEFKVILHWNKGDKNIGTKINTVTMIEMTNGADFNDSDDKNNQDTATLLLTIATGDLDETILETVYLILILITFAIELKVIKKKF